MAVRMDILHIEDHIYTINIKNIIFPSQQHIKYGSYMSSILTRLSFDLCPKVQTDMYNDSFRSISNFVHFNDVKMRLPFKDARLFNKCSRQKYLFPQIIKNVIRIIFYTN